MMRVINHLKAERLAELQQALLDKQTEAGSLEGDLADLALELNYCRDRQESREIMDSMSIKEEALGDLLNQIDQIKDRIYEQ